MYAIVDCNSFYASCERVFNPKSRNKPVVVLSNNDGVVIAATKEAKDLGLQWQPYFKIKDICKKHDVQVFSSNYTLYGDLSRRVMQVLAEFAPEIEIYSIDEAFLNFKGLEYKDFNQYAHQIRDTVYKWTGIPVSIGIGRTKTLAKLANKYSKKHSGVLILDTPAKEKHFMEQTPVEDIWGVGRQYAKLLQSKAIMNANQFAELDENWVRKKMTVMGLRTFMELNGKPCINLEETIPNKKSIVTSRMFSKVTDYKTDLMEAVASYTAKAASKMRKQESLCSVLSVFIATSPFRKSPQYSNSAAVTLGVPSDITIELIDAAIKALEQIYKKGYEYQRCGVMLTGFIPNTALQFNMFDSIGAEKRKELSNLSKVVDKINSKYDYQVLYYGSQGIKKPWSMNRNFKSNHYTTDLKDILVVHNK